MESNQKCPFSGANLEKEFKPYEQEGMFEFFQEARESKPVFYNEELDCWVVTRKDDVLSIFRDVDRFSASNAQSAINEYSPEVQKILTDGNFTREPTQANTDRPKHTRIRNAAGQFLNLKRFQQYRDVVRELTRKQLAALEGKKTIDIVEEVTYELPAKILFEVVGVPQQNSLQIKKWSDNRFNMVWGKPTEEESLRGAEELLDYWNFCKSVVADHEDNLSDDYISHLLRYRNGDDNILTMNEVHSLVHGVLLAGHETTSNGSANLLWALLSNKEQWEKIVADPTLIPNAVEEGLRYMTPFITWRRLALVDVEVSGVTIPKGAHVLLSLISANHDEKHFECPLEFNVERKNSRQHAAFGNGIHFCMGAPLARLEMITLLEELVAKFPNLSMVEDQEIEWPYNMGFRGPLKLMVNLGE